MTKLSDLIADPNTKLTAVAAGDYVIIYDVSEPLDTRKVKVIPVSDFQNSINPPAVIARTGSYATMWDFGGSTIYQTPNSKAQLCTGYVQFSNSSDTEASVSVVYPYEFDDRPAVIPFFLTVSIYPGMTIETVSNSATGCTLNARKLSGNSVLTFGVGCLAIGDITA